jgi:ribosome-associated protein
MIRLTPSLLIADDEVQLTAVRAQGAGGQNVNKVSSAIHLRFDIAASSLPERIKTRLLAQSGHHLTQDGVIVIKALARLVVLVRAASVVRRSRIATRPTRAAKERRIESKKHRAQIKAGRRTERE